MDFWASGCPGDEGTVTGWGKLFAFDFNFKFKSRFAASSAG